MFANEKTNKIEGLGSLLKTLRKASSQAGEEKVDSAAATKSLQEFFSHTRFKKLLSQEKGLYLGTIVFLQKRVQLLQ